MLTLYKQFREAGAEHLILDSWGIPVVPRPEPEPWFNAFNSKLSPVSLNPQPLPPAELQGFTVGF